MSQLPRESKILNRKKLICETIRDKKVLHIGCTDYPFTEERLQNGTLLHQEMASYTSYLVGIDIEKESILTMKKYGIKDVYRCSVYELRDLSKEKINKNFDYIVITEVLEHVPNAGLALEGISEYMKKYSPNAKLLVTVPNIHNYLRNFIDVILNREQVHPDHLCYYSYNTIKNLLERNGFEILNIRYVTYGLGRFTFLIASFLNLLSSSFLPSIYVESKLKGKIDTKKS